eukprot:287845-Pleurochrysis_carterae.AAC.1
MPLAGGFSTACTRVSNPSIWHGGRAHQEGVVELLTERRLTDCREQQLCRHIPRKDPHVVLILASRNTKDRIAQQPAHNQQ